MKFGFFTIIIMVFIGYIAIAPSGTRIDRFCQPVNWTGNLTVSVGQLIDPDSQDNIQGFFDKANYSCRFMVWRLIYEEKYLKESK